MIKDGVYPKKLDIENMSIDIKRFDLIDGIMFSLKTIVTNSP